VQLARHTSRRSSSVGDTLVCVFFPQQCLSVCYVCLVRLFDGLRWEARLAVFSDTFAKRKAELSLALSIHTAQGVHGVQHSLVDIEAIVKTGSDSAAMLLLFHELESPAERELRKWITDKGGPNTVSGNEKARSHLITGQCAKVYFAHSLAP
jgi:hypothetical protein